MESLKVISAETQECIKRFNLPNVQIGDVVKLLEIWDGEGERPLYLKNKDSYSYKIGESLWINYEFENTYTICHLGITKDQQPCCFDCGNADGFGVCQTPRPRPALEDIEVRITNVYML